MSHGLQLACIDYRDPEEKKIGHQSLVATVLILLIFQAFEKMIVEAVEKMIVEAKQKVIDAEVQENY